MMYFLCMVRTQIQLPDSLYIALKRVAEAREWSLAEALRRGAEYVVQTFPPHANTSAQRELPEPINLELTCDPFDDPNWREQANLGTGAAEIVAARLREQAARYGASQ